MNTALKVRSSLLLVGAALVLAACPKVPDADPLEPAPTVVSFTASDSEVSVGDKVTLSWKVTGATEVKVSEAALGAVSGVSGAEGSVEVGITGESLFVLTARNARGAVDTAVVVVHVGGALGDVFLAALPDQIHAGESATLAWTAPGATSVTLTADPGGAVDLHGQLTSGAVAVNPTSTTTYTLTAGVRTATARVVVAPTLLQFSASPLSADAGATVTLSWATADATRVQLTAPGRGALVDTTDAARMAAGTFDDVLPTAVDPGALFAYQLTVTGAGATLTDSVVVSINGNPAIVSFDGPTRSRDPNAGALPDGGTGPTTILLAWKTREAASVSLSANGTEFYRAPESQLAVGTLTLPAPAADTTYLLTARGARGGVVTDTVDVDVVGKPMLTVTTTPGTVAAGTPVTFSWTGTNLDTVVVTERGFGGVYSGTGNTGMTQLLPNADTTWDAVASNGVGDTTTASASVTVTSPITLTVTDQGTLRSGQTATVTWAAPGTPSLVGMSHAFVDTRAMSTGFDDISTTGTAVDLSAGGGSWGTIVTPFRTMLFGRAVGENIIVSRYGYLTFSGAVNPGNSSEALPTARLEPWTIAPYWDSLTLGSGIYWQLKEVSGQQQLIVQWVMSSATYQAKIYASGQIDFEYLTLPTTIGGHTGVVGGRPTQYVVGTPAASTGLTFFGPRPSPLQVQVTEPGTLGGFLDIGGRMLRVSTTVDVVKADQFGVNEVMAASPFGVPGQWLELRNGRDTAVALTGWSVGLADGGAAALSGSAPPRSVYVVGASTDPALNGDAGVQVAITDFDLTGVANLTLSRGGVHQTASVTGDAGTAWVFDPGPFLGTATTRCAATTAFGGQLGTPGTDTGCGFPYALSSIAPGYYDISGSGTAVVQSDFDDEINVVSLTAAPFPFFGAARTSVQVSTNGFATFDTTAASSGDYMSSSTPSTSDSNLRLAIFGDDCSSNLLFADAQIFSKRVAPNEDPFAAAPHWIIQWHHWSHYTSTGTSADDLNFQIKLFDDGTVEYHFAKMRSQNSSSYGSGASAVTWLENAGGTAALSINVQATTPGLSPYSAFRFVPR